MIEFRLHGRGGQGTVTSSKIAGVAAAIDGKFAQSLPFYGFERRGAPVEVYFRLDDKPVTVNTRIYNPDGIIVLDPVLPFQFTQLVTKGLKQGAIAILNTAKKPEDINLGVKLSKVFVVDATSIALEILKAPITNTAILGAFSGGTKLLKLDSVVEGVKHVLPERLWARNIEAVKRAYNEVKVKEW